MKREGWNTWTAKITDADAEAMCVDAIAQQAAYAAMLQMQTEVRGMRKRPTSRN